MFSAHERAIFGPYFNGLYNVHGDPIRIMRRLKGALDGELNEAIQSYNSEVGHVSNQAADRLVPASVYAFDLVPFDPATGQGLQEDQILGVLHQFLGWVKKKETNTENRPTSQQPTGSLVTSPTTDSSGCG